jgi:hypothetical protein
VIPKSVEILGSSCFCSCKIGRASCRERVFKFLARHVFPIVNHSNQSHLNPIHD